MPGSNRRRILSSAAQVIIFKDDHAADAVAVLKRNAILLMSVFGKPADDVDVVGMGKVIVGLAQMTLKGAAGMISACAIGMNSGFSFRYRG